MNGLIPLCDYEAAIAHLAALPPPSKAQQQHYFTPHSHLAVQDVRIHEADVAHHTDDDEQDVASSLDDEVPGQLTLPPELLRAIALVLFDEMRPTLPSWSSEVWPEEGYNALEAAAHKRASLHALIAFSSTSLMLRSLLGPLIWAHPEPLTHPLHLASLTNLLEFYVGPHATQHDRLPYPPPLLQSLSIRFPSRFPAVNQPALALVLSASAGAATDDSPQCRLRDFTFESEEAPGCAVLRALLSPPDRVAADRRIKQRRDALSGEAARRKEQKLHSEQSQEIVEWERNAIGAYPLRISLSQDRDEEEQGDELHQLQHHDGLESLSLSCGTFWPGHALLSSLRRLQHLRLTSYEAHLLPPHLPPLLLASHSPLKSLSMSTSKTALLHVPSLIEAGCFSQLTHLDIYPVTPEQPLARALRSARRTLRVLRITLDVSGAFQNYNALWKDLTNGCIAEAEEEVGMPELEVLIVDPYPQQNTAPSFKAFLAACPKLRLVNGHDAERLRLTGGESLDPDHYTGALPY